MARKPISPADMGSSPLNPVAKAFNCMVSNVVLAHYKTYTAFCDALRGSPVRPCWVFQNKPTSEKARGQERTECGKYFGVGARKTAEWGLLDWVVRQVTPEEDLRVRQQEWAREWTASTGRALPMALISGDDAIVGELKAQVVALSEARDKAIADRDRVLHDLDMQVTQVHWLQKQLAETRTGSIALDNARKRDRARFDAEQRHLHEEVSKQGTERLALVEQAEACRQSTALLLAFLAGVDSTVKADVALTSFGSRSDVTTSISTCLPPALAALLDFDFDAVTTRSARRFAIYVHALLLGDGTRPLELSQAATGIGISAPTLEAILDAQCLPTHAQLRDIIAFCPAVGVHGQSLLTDAHAGALVPPVRTSATTRDHVGRSHSVRLTVRTTPPPSVSPQRPPTGVVSREPRPRWMPQPRRAQPPLFGAGPFRETPIRQAAAQPTRRRRWIWWSRTLSVALPISVLAVATVWWIADSVGVRLSIAQGTLVGAGLAVLGGDMPSTLQADEGAFSGMAWAGLSHGTPQATTFQPVRHSTPYQGLKGVLWLQHPDGCSPSVAVRVHLAGGSETLSWLRDNVLDLSTDVDVEPSWNNRFRIEFTRLDTDACPVSVMWSGAGTR